MTAGLSHSDRIFVAGHRGLVGSAICRRLAALGYRSVVTASRDEVDLANQGATTSFFERVKPDVVFMAAAKVGGILANNVYRADFILQNLQIECNVVDSAFRSGVRRFIFLGSSCVYPKMAAQPMAEDSLLTGDLEYTNRPYALAKIAGMELINALNEQHGCRYFSVMPTNLYGPNDNFDANESHVLPALLRRFLEAKEVGAGEVVLWGTGTPKREFLYSDDCADAIVYLAENLGEDFFESVRASKQRFYHVNVGSGEETTIANLASLIQTEVGFEGTLRFDPEKPDGTPRKLMNSSLLMKMGWKPKVGLRAGIHNALEWYLQNRKA